MWDYDVLHIGKTYGPLRVINSAGRSDRRGWPICVCQCKCGNIVSYPLDYIMRIVGDECQCGKKDVPGPPHVDLVYQVRQFYDKSRKTIIVEEIPRSDVENTKRSVTDSGEAMIVVDYFANCAAAEEFAELCWNDGILPIRTNGMRSGTKKKPKVLGLSDTLMELCVERAKQFEQRD